MAGNRKQGRTARAIGPKRCEPCGTVAHDGRHACQALRIVDRCRLAIQTKTGRERWLEAWPALLAFQGFQQRSFFATNVGPCPNESVQVEIDTRALNIPAKQPCVIGFFYRSLESWYWLSEEFATYVIVGDRCAHRVSRDGHALNQYVRVVPEDVAIMTGARLAFVRVADQVFLRVRVTRHEAPLQSCREAGTTATAKPRGFDLVNNLIRSQLACQYFAPGLVSIELFIGRQRP